MRKWGKDWGPGWVYYSCQWCGFRWSHKSRDCTSLSGDDCDNCGEFCSPNGHQMHLEWPVDVNKNLMPEGEK